MKRLLLTLAVSAIALLGRAQNCPQINAGNDVSLSCVQNCTTLHATAQAVNSTAAYSLSSTGYSPFSYAGTAVSFTQGDRWSQVIPIPFKFCFYGKTYDRVVIGENGVVSFDTTYAGQVCNWQVMSLPYSGNTAGNNVPFPLNAIFGPYHDLDLLSGGAISYQTVGSYPCRKFVISYNNVPLYNCSASTTKQQIVLYETTNTIDQYIDHKDVCNSWLAGNAVQGIQNETGSAAVAVSGRNGTNWTANSDGQRYTPSGAPTYSISWLNSAGTVIASGVDSVVVCPTATSFYVARVSYDCGPTPVMLYDTVVVNKPLKPTIAISGLTMPLCNGQVTGGVTITATSGQTPYTYKIDVGTFGPSGNFSGLAAGNHTLTAKDANGCEHDTVITITQPAAIQATAAVTPTSCAGISTLVITATGGTAPYSYALGTGSYQTSNTFTGVNPGTYTVHIKDANGCIKDTPVTVAAPANALHAGVSFLTIPCNGGTTTVTVNASGGLAPYQYAANGGTFQAGNTFTLGAGTHTVTIKDNAGCTDDTTFTLGNPPLVGFTVTTVLPACQGVTGSITVNGIGGTPGYTYSINGNIPQATNTFGGLLGGSYTISIIDSRGCQKDSVVTLNTLSPIMANATIVPAGCSNGAGSITSNPFGGTPPYTYTLNNGAFGSGNSFTGLTAGTYTLSVKDANGCRKDTVIQIKMSPTLGITASGAFVGCSGGNNGTVTANATGGSGVYTYSINGVTFQSSNVFTNLVPGTYTVTVKDNQGCEEGTTVVISNPPPMSVSIAINPVPCFNGVGEFSINVTGGTLPYQYAINTGAYNSQWYYAGVVPGTYTLHIKDNSGCQKDTTIIVTNPAPLLIASFSATPIGCSGVSSSVNIAGTGGTAPYSYAYDGNGYVATGALSVPAGTHTIHIKDAHNCIKDTNITLAQPTPYSIAVSYPAIACNGGATTVTLSASGSTGFTYSMAAGAFGPSNVFTGVPGGAINFHVKDVNGCVHDTAFVITEPAKVNAAASVVPVSCNGDSATITLTGNGGTAPHTYALNTGTFGTNSTFKVPAGTYSFHIKDAKGCTKDSTFTFLNPAPIFVDSFKIVNVICYSDSSGSITLFAGGGAGPYQYAVDNNPFGTLNSFSNLVTGSHTVKIKDALNCIKDTTLFVPTLPQLNVSLQVDTPSCITSLNGSVVLSATGGVPPYQFSLGTGPFTGTNTFTGLLPGTYMLHIRDSVKCIRDTSITIPGPVAIVPNVVRTNVTCNGAATGTILVTATGGYAPYQYRLNSGSFSAVNNFTSLTAGTYTLSVRDNKNCIKDTILVITEPPAIHIDSASIVNPSCSGTGNGKVTIWAQGGVPGYTYAISTGTYTASPVFNGLNAGTFTFHVKDANGCIKDTVITLLQPSTLQANVTAIANVTCNGGSNGSATLAGAGGTLPYTYAMGTGAYSATTSFNGLAAGAYTFHVKDAGNCVKDTVVNITQPTPVAVAAVVTPVLCFGQNNGSVTLTGTGGTPGYTYTQGTGAYSASAVFASLAVGSYTFHVKDTNGCVKDTIISITQPVAVQANVTVVPVTCAGSLSDGTITAAGAGGVSPYTYALGTGAYSASGLFTGLAVGTYTVHTKDANGCIKDTVIQIITPTPVRIDSVQVTPITCNGQTNGSLKVFAGGGAIPYQYAINAGAFGSASTFGGLAAGTYTLTVKTSNGCTKDTIITLSQPSVLQATGISITNVNCSGGNNGTITLSGSGGTPAYTYALGTGAYSSTNTFGTLAAGTYTLHIKDARNCVKDTTLTIAQPSAIAVAAVVTKVKCFGETTGGIALSATGGTPGYTYAMNGNGYISNSNFTNLPAGTYTMHIKDANGCVKDTTVTIAQPQPLAMQLQVSDITCTGNMQDGKITVLAAGGTSPYQYAINSGAFGSTTQFSNLNGGSYTIHLKDTNGCIKDTTITLDNPSKLAIAVTVENAKCFGDANGAVNVTVLSGNPQYSYQFGSSAIAGPTGSTYSFTNLSAQQNQTLTVTDSRGCHADTVLSITQPAALLLEATGADIACYGDRTGTLDLVATGGAAPYKYIVNGTSYGTTGHIPALPSGYYQVQVTDANNCTITKALDLKQPDAPLRIAIDKEDVNCMGLGKDGWAIASMSGGTSPYTYRWSFDPSLQKLRADSLGTGKYYFAVTDAHNCKDSASFEIDEKGCCSMFVPNAFSPNGDQNNDHFRVLTDGNIDMFDLSVYNRYGERVFNTTIYDKGWDGNYKGEKSEIGTYFYTVKYRCLISKQIKYLKGDVILLR